MQAPLLGRLSTVMPGAGVQLGVAGRFPAAGRSRGGVSSAEDRVGGRQDDCNGGRLRDKAEDDPAAPVLEQLRPAQPVVHRKDHDDVVQRPYKIRLRTRRSWVASSIRSIVLSHHSKEGLFEALCGPHGLDSHTRDDQRLIELLHRAPWRGDE